MALFSSLFSVLGLATWILLPLNAIFLTLDGIVYSLVAYSYRIFEIIAQLNVNTIITWVGPVIDRVKSLILVLIMFKLGIALIQYMVNPDQIEDKNIGGAALVKNIFIVAVLLVTYNFVFTLFNELSLLIVGTPNGYEFTALKDLAGVSNSGQDNGLISRFIFGSESADKDFGQFLAVNTLETFLHSKDGQSTDLNRIYNEMESADIDSGTFDMMEIITIVDEIGRTVQYRWPLISTVVGIYLIYCLIKLCIELGIRAFKIVILQLIAPVAIVTIIDKGWKSDTWQKYIKLYTGVYIQAFTLVGTMYMVCALICTAYKNLGELLVVGDTDGLTAGIIKLIIIFAGFKMVNILPKFLEELGVKMGGGNVKTSFGSALGGIVGTGFGLASGVATGIRSGAGLMGTLGNAVSGAYNGGVSGAKGKNVADFFKNEGAVSKANRERAAAIARQGGGLRYAGSRIEGALGIPNAQAQRSQRYADASSAFDNMVKERGAALANVESTHTNAAGERIKYGASADSFVSEMMKVDSAVLAAEAAYEHDKSVANKQTLEAARINAEKTYKTEYNNQLFTNSNVNNNSRVKEASSVFNRANRGVANGVSTSQLTSEAARAGGDAGRLMKQQKNATAAAQERIQNKGATVRANRQGTFNSK